MTTQQTPTIGRMVHFVYGDRHVPAVITDPAYRVTTDVYDQIEQALTVFPVGEPPFTTVATLDTSGSPATWHWMEYVPPPGVVVAPVGDLDHGA